MNVRVPESLLKVDDAQLVIDAVYYVVRVLRNSSRGYTRTDVSTEPSRRARRLAELAIRDIEAATGTSIRALQEQTINAYIKTLEGFLERRTLADEELPTVEAESMLRKMRDDFSGV